MWGWLRTWRSRAREDDEAKREMAAHIELLAERYRRSGLSVEDADVAARRQFGNVTTVREELYRMNGVSWIDGISQDLRYAWRQVCGSPGFAAVVAATLALGIGGATAVFSVAQAVLLAPLPYEQPGQLVRLYQHEPNRPETRNYIAGPHFRTVRDDVAAFESVAGLYTYSEVGRDLVMAGEAQRLRVMQVTGDYFQTLRAGALRGPGFDRRDDTGTRRVVLSDALWRTRFAGDPSAIGSTVQLSGEPYEIAGIAPPGFTDPIAGAFDAWLPYNLARENAEENYTLTAVARLRHGVSVEQARAELASLSPSMAARWPAAKLSAIEAVPLKEDITVHARGPLQLLLAAVALVLVVACVNVANLVLARSTGRAHEFATRLALGSGSGRLVRQLLVESLVLAGLGGLGGLLLARAGIALLRDLGRDAFPRLDQVGFDPVVLGFAMLITVATAVAFGVMPALRFGRTAPVQALRQQSRSATGSRRQGRIRNGLAAAQVALALTLVTGAGVLTASFLRLQRVELGFRVDDVFTFDVSLPTVRYDAARRVAFQEELSARLRAMPGAIAAGGISFLPATGSYHTWATALLTGPRAGSGISRGAGYNIQQRTISGDLFGALDIPILAGRAFDARDDVTAPGRAVISANLARAGFPGLSFDAVVGQRIRAGGRQLDVIGVSGDVPLDPYGDPSLVVYHAHRQFAGNRNWSLTQAVRTARPPDALIADVRAVVAGLDPELVVHHAAPMADVVGRGVSRDRFALVLMLTFAGISLALAALGLYGVLAYAVRQRTHEIGIRIALGATAAQVRGLILRQAAAVIGIGLILGLAGAMLLGRWLSALVFQTSPWDPRILVATTLLLAITGLGAAWLPTRRASRIPPRVAMMDV